MDITLLRSVPAKLHAVAIDMDGTLLTHDLTLTERTRRSVNACLDAGIPVIVATSRARRVVARYLGDDLSQRCSLVVMNGALALGAGALEGEVRRTLPPETTGVAVGLALQQRPEARVVVEIDGFRFGCNVWQDPAQLWEFNSATPDMALSLEEALLHHAGKVAVDGNGQDLSALAAAVTERLGDAVRVVGERSGSFLNVMHPQASKLAALEALLAGGGYGAEHLVALGDDLPDVAMLGAAGLGIAMGNALPEVRRATRYSTATNNGDGVALALEHLLDAGFLTPKV